MSVDSIHETLLEQIPDSYQKTVGFPSWMLTRAMAVGLADGMDALADAQAQLDPENLSGAALDAYILPRTGQIRTAATYAVGTVTVTGTGTVAQGDLFETVGGVRFAADETVIVDGSAAIEVTCVTAGAAGNVAAQAVTMMPVQIAGISAVTNSAPMTGGYDAESDADYYARFLERLRAPVNGSNKAQYAAWAKEVAGVGEVKVFSLGHGDNTVDVVLTGSDGKPAAASLVQAVQAHIDPGSAGKGEGRAGIGAHCYVSAAETLPVTLSVTVHKLSGYTDEQVTQAVSEAAAAYLAGIAFRQDYVSYAKLSETIGSAPGVLDHESLRISGGTANIEVGARQCAVLGEAAITIG